MLELHQILHLEQSYYNQSIDFNNGVRICIAREPECSGMIFVLPQLPLSLSLQTPALGHQHQDKAPHHEEAQSQRKVECSQWAVHRCVLATQAALILKFPAQPPGSSKSWYKRKSAYKTITKQCRQTDTSCSQTTYRPIITGCHFSLASKRMRKIIVVLQIQTNLQTKKHVDYASNTDGKCCRK